MTRGYAPIRKLIVHHTGGAEFRSNPIGALQLIWNEQVVRRGYGDIGYNFAIDAHGTIYEGRWARQYQPGEVHDGEDSNGLGVIGAHALGVNAGSCAVVLIGDYDVVPPTAAMIAALTHLLAWKAATHQIDALRADRYRTLQGQVLSFPNIAGHREVGMTLCPGSRVVTQLGPIRRAVEGSAGTFGAAETNTVATTRYRFGGP